MCHGAIWCLLGMDIPQTSHVPNDRVAGEIISRFDASSC